MADNELPKYKTLGLISAHATNNRPTANISNYKVAWVTGLAFRNKKANGATAALCVTPNNQDPKKDGLHLAPDAARQLAVDLLAQVKLPGASVSVNNHRKGEENVWEVFSDGDAGTLASRITVAVSGH